MDALKTPIFKVFYKGHDLAGWISDALISIEYTDFLKDQTDELRITMEDSQQLWKNQWYPKKGDKFSLKIGYEGEALRDCGAFELDELEFSGLPDIITLKALAADISKPVREENTVAYENQTLDQIAAQIAEKHSFELSGVPKNIKVQRITQNQEKDLAFLKRLSDQYGYAFKVHGNKLVFTDISQLYNIESSVLILKEDCTQYSFRDKTESTYSAVQVNYFDPEKKEVISASAVGKSATTKQDTMKITERCENKEQAQAKADAALQARNKQQIEGSVSMPGDKLYRAGMNISARGFGKFDIKYSVQTVKHRLDRNSGYTTELDLINV